MKTAKEWAAESIEGPDRQDLWTWRSRLAVDQDYVPLEPQEDREDSERLCDNARGVIERLVERVQADARAPLEAEIARLRQENQSLRVDIEMATGVPYRETDDAP
jgi:hypothetical protein